GTVSSYVPPSWFLVFALTYVVNLFFIMVHVRHRYFESPLSEKHHPVPIIVLERNVLDGLEIANRDKVPIDIILFAGFGVILTIAELTSLLNGEGGLVGLLVGIGAVIAARIEFTRRRSVIFIHSL